MDSEKLVIEYRELKEKERFGELTTEEQKRLVELEQDRATIKKVTYFNAWKSVEKIVWPYAVIAIMLLVGIYFFTHIGLPAAAKWREGGLVVYRENLQYPAHMILARVLPGDDVTVALRIQSLKNNDGKNEVFLQIDELRNVEGHTIGNEVGLRVSEQVPLAQDLLLSVGDTFSFKVAVPTDTVLGTYEGTLTLKQGSIFRKRIPIVVEVETRGMEYEYAMQRAGMDSKIMQIQSNANPSSYDAVLYVSHQGNDNWSGRLAECNTSNTDGPFRTIERAMIEVRAIKASNEFTRSIAVLLREGTYALDAPLVFTAQDGGSIDEQISVTYSAYENEQVILSGGQQIDGWEEAELDGKRLWKAYLPEVSNGDWYFTQLFVNGERRLRPRLPEKGYYRIEGLPGVTIDTPWDEGQNCLKFKADQFSASWTNLQDVEVVALHYWVESRLPVASVDEITKIVSFTKDSVIRLTETSEGSTLARYYIENVFEALDTPGQWYLNRETGIIYYYPLEDESIETVDVIAPRIPQLLRVIGAPLTGYVENLHFSDLVFAHTQRSISEKVAGSVQAGVAVPATIFLTGTRHCSLRNSTIKHIGTYGVEVGVGTGWGFTQDFAFSRIGKAFGLEDNLRALRGALESTGEYNLIEGNLFTDMGAGAIKVNAETMGTLIVGNEIGHGGKIYHGAVGIYIGDSGDNMIRGNYIHNFDYSGISLGWVWALDMGAARNNIVEGNHICYIGRGVLSDLGGIYTAGSRQGTVIRNNHIHDVYRDKYGGYGIYVDSGSNMLIQNNLVYRTSDGGLNMGTGRNNVVRNNIFAFGKESQIPGGHPYEEKRHTLFRFEQNIVYFSGASVLSGGWGGYPKTDIMDFDYNIYYSNTHKSLKFSSLNFKDWISQNMDKYSLVVDPLFVDPDNGDYTLLENSPAFIFGFQPFEVPDFCKTGMK